MNTASKSRTKHKPNFTHDELMAINAEIGLLLRKILEMQATISALRSYDVDIPIDSVSHLNQAKQLLQESRNDVIDSIKQKRKAK